MIDSSTAQRFGHADAEQSRRTQKIERNIDDLVLRSPKTQGGGSGAGSGSNIPLIQAETWEELRNMEQSTIFALGYTIVDEHSGTWVVSRWICTTHFVDYDESEE